MIPTEALIRTGTRNVVIVAQNEGRFVQVDVQTGIESGDKTEIRSGLEEGQKVVISGQFLIDSEASLRGSSVRMGDGSAATHTSSGQMKSNPNGDMKEMQK